MKWGVGRRPPARHPPGSALATRKPLGYLIHSERSFGGRMAVYDHAFYKRLTKNDCGPKTHQGGPAIPVGLRPYFPPLPDPSLAPTEEYFITLDLMDGSTPAGVVTSRWHFQTWTNKRRPETRLTNGIKPRLLKTAKPGDYVVFQRQLDRIDRYRVELVRQGTAEHGGILPADSRRAWGPLSEVPASLTAIHEYMEGIGELLSRPLQLFTARQFDSPHTRLLRDAAFGRVVKQSYDAMCALCHVGLVNPVDDAGHEPPTEPEAAHVVPVAAGGSDDVRNGLCLCRRHHWAFDVGLIYVDADRRWGVTERAQKEPRNHDLVSDHGIHLTDPEDSRCKVADEALAWHRQNVVLP